MATMVWCNSCKKVVWAYDHITADVRGICNIFKLPCPKCGAEGNFDGWSSETAYLDALDIFGKNTAQIYDNWSAMRVLADRSFKVAWEPSPDNRWFPRESDKQDLREEQ